MSNHHLFSFLFILLLLCVPTYSHFITDRPSSSSTSDLVSDGVRISPRYRSSELLLNRFSAESTCDCDQTYGFLPCTTSVVGNMFLIIGYGYLMFLGAKCLSNGCELLLEVLGPGIVGGLLLPILGSLSDAILILVSGVSGSTETAQSQVSVGMGLLAGSNVMLLTVIWGTCVIVGKCDLADSVAQDKQDTKGFSLTESGVSTDIWTSYTARIMAISVIPFVIVQIPQAISTSSGKHLAVLIGLIVSLLLLISYCVYQVLQPWIQTRKIAYAKHKHVIVGLLRHLKERSLGRLLTIDGQPNTKVIEKLFTAIDTNGDGHISDSELRELIVRIRFGGEIDLNHDDAVTKIMTDFDTSNDTLIDKDEFVSGISKWLIKTKPKRFAAGESGPHTFKHFHYETTREHDLLDVRDQSEEVAEGGESSKWTSIKAVLLLFLGTAIAAAFSEPLVDAVDNFSDATGIPTFFISFIALPLATSSSDAVSAIIFASRNKRETASFTFSELYGSVTMNNVLSLSVFLALVYIRGLTWEFSSEVLVIAIVCIVMGALGSFRTHYPLWTSILAFLLYPFSLALVYVLDYVLGWS